MFQAWILQEERDMEKNNNSDHLDHPDHLEHPDHLDYLDHLDHLDHLDNLDHLDHLDHLNHLDQLNKLWLIKGFIKINTEFALFTWSYFCSYIFNILLKGLLPLQLFLVAEDCCGKK